MSRLSVRLFVSYLLVVLISTGVAFVTARALAPTFFRVNLEQGRPDESPASTLGPGRFTSSSSSTSTTVREPATSTATSQGGTGSSPTSSQARTTATRHASSSTGPLSTTGPGTGSTQRRGDGTSTTGRGNGDGSSASPSGRDGEGGVIVGTLAAGGVQTTVVELDREVTEAFRSAINSALLVAMAVSSVVAFGFSWLVARRILLPLSRLREATVRLAEGHYSERVPVPTEEELAAFAQDVNRLAETLEATEQRRTRLISDVAHELRTPLTTIQGSMEALMDGVLAPTDEVFASVAEEATRLQRVVSDLGLLSRLDEAALNLAMRPADLAEVARAVAARLLPQYQEKAVDLVVDLPDDLFVEGDQDRLAQVFTNLIGNALGHTPAGGTVAIRGRAAAGMAEITVTDTGEGIASDEIEEIFERFHRGRSARRQGTGLGLTIARSLARAHGGDVTARSAGPGTGATFAVRIPQRRVEPGRVGSWSWRRSRIR